MVQHRRQEACPEDCPLASLPVWLSYLLWPRKLLGGVA
jgi:hypothetical protein